MDATLQELIGQADRREREDGRSDYWTAYRLGLKRAYGTLDALTRVEQDMLVGLLASPEQEWADRGAGYHDGLEVGGVAVNLVMPEDGGQPLDKAG